MKKILVIGRLPPPIGGVTRHVSRLIYHLDNEDIPFTFVDVNKLKKITSFLFTIFSHPVIHLNSCNVWVRAFFSILSTLTGKKLILSFFGNLGNRNWFENKVDECSIRLASFPIVLNADSFSIARKLNVNARQISSFIPPKEQKPLDIEVQKIILEGIGQKYNQLFCTYAYDLAFDKNGDEIYQITELTKLFSQIPQFKLIISDPSGHNLAYLNKKKIKIPQNIILLTKPHSFIELLKISDCYIRATTTDGDSIAVKEALYFKTPVIASKCVNRPPGCILYDTYDYIELQKTVESFNRYSFRDISIVSGTTELIRIYKQLIE